MPDKLLQRGKRAQRKGGGTRKGNDVGEEWKINTEIEGYAISFQQAKAGDDLIKVKDSADYFGRKAAASAAEPLWIKRYKLYQI